VADGQVANVRTDDAVGCAVSPDGSALYYAKALVQSTGSWDIELRVARPENGPSVPIARVSASRISSNRSTFKRTYLPTVDGSPHLSWTDRLRISGHCLQPRASGESSPISAGTT
jgi:hypothetical protein